MPTRKKAPEQPSADQPQNHGLPALTPDVVEQEEGAKIENVVPTQSYAKLPVVGLGGSAGGLTALQGFFAAMSPESGMAFVVIMHLSPSHESILAEVLQRATSMPVRQVRDRTKVEANHVYVIPPAKNLSMEDGHLRLSDPAQRSGKHVAVDLFFRTLADTHGAHAAAIVLSGADGDGAVGIKRIKERGGLTVAQDPTEAEHDSMPQAAIGTGMVDWALPVADMPAKLIAYWQTELRLRLPTEEGPQPAKEEVLGEPGKDHDSPEETALHEILGFLRARTGRDFTYYKRATILRRIARRMQVNGIEEMGRYLGFLRTHPGEAGALLQDMLISVTNFFRDRESFAALEAMIPGLFDGKGPNDTVRVWSAACATGEEAYSIAMLLHEHAGKLDRPPSIQVFATDLDENAIQMAREGVYSQTISADVSEERLRRFFAVGQGNYRVKREVRESVLFALHDLLKDSPFSRLDLVSCRNLMIYLNRDAQERALEIFHFALHPAGVLFLGSSESVDEDNALFAVTDKKHCLYTRRLQSRPKLPVLFSGPSAQTQALWGHHLEGPVVLKAASLLSERPTGLGMFSARPSVPEGQTSWGEVHARGIERFGPPSVIINQEHEIVHLSGQLGQLLRLGPGEPTMNLMDIVHPMLRIELRAAIFRAKQSGNVVETYGVPVEAGGLRRVVDIRAVPTLENAPGFLLVIFTEREPATAMEGTSVVGTEPEPAVRALEREVEQLKARLRDTVEHAEASQEESKASNEELQAMNEELRSATEELETGREELQSINEELKTVNQELKLNVEELGHSNSDLSNLMASTQIATVFLDRQLCIQRYTPPALALFNLRQSDVGRPLSDLTHQLNYPALAASAERVLKNLSTAELEVAHSDGHYFLARMLPYRTVDDHIAGVVLTFVDITHRRQVEEDLQASETRFRAVADLVPDLLFSTDPAGQLVWCNRRWLTYTGHTLAQTQGFGWVGSVHPEDRVRVQQSFRAAIEQRQPFHSEHRFMAADGTARWYLVRAEPLLGEKGEIIQWFGAKTDIEDFKRASANLAASEERLRLVVENAREFAIFSMDLERRVTSWNPGAEQILGYSEKEILFQSGDVIFTPEDRAAGGPRQEAEQALAEGRAIDERWHLRKDDSQLWGSGAMMAMHGVDGQAVGLVKILRDQTDARATREALEQSREKLVLSLQQTEAARAEAEAANRTKDHFLAVLSHELRTPLMPVMMAVHMLGYDSTLSESAREAVGMIRRNVEIEARFIDDLLDVTRITRGKLEIVREPMDLHQALRHAVEVSTADIESKRQRLKVELKAKQHSLMGDATRLQQLFWNLLKNASKFTPEGGEISVVTRNRAGGIIVEVSDTGVGFEPEAATRIFEAFEQATPETAREFGGLGLGLAIANATADAHGGSLRAHSAGRNKGATFTLELPLSV